MVGLLVDAERSVGVVGEACLPTGEVVGDGDLIVAGALKDQ
ncbi:hypothetical protein ACQPW1_15995 [Nocardia sp. CA-128927]